MRTIIIHEQDDGSIVVAATSEPMPEQFMQGAQPAESMDDALAVARDVMAPEGEAAPGAEGAAMPGQPGTPTAGDGLDQIPVDGADVDAEENGQAPKRRGPSAFTSGYQNAKRGMD